MAYMFRDRNKRSMRLSSSSSSGSDRDSDDSSYSDPDYHRTTTYNSRRRNNTCGQMEGAPVSRRVRGRPPKRSGNGEGELLSSEEKPRRRRKTVFSRASTSRRNANHEVKRTILSWLIEWDIVKENETVCYKNESDDDRVALQGRVTRGGILCNCCGKEMTVDEFEQHAGSDTKRPYSNIFLVNSGDSLLQCQIKAWQSGDEVARRTFNHFEPRDGAIDKNDDACLICADGGDLICCDTCPSTFHPICMDMEEIPQGVWLCPFCVCKHCANGEGELFTCIQCDKKYHWDCFQERQLPDLDLNIPSTSFCGHFCREVYGKLQKLVGVRNEIDDKMLTWSLIRPMEPGSALFSDTNNIEHKSVQCNSKVALAWWLMNDCFLTNLDRHTKINVIQSVVYGRGSNLTRINFSRFYTVILEIGDEVVSAASLRIHSPKLAEMPYIATGQKYRLQGMSRKLIIAIESALCSLNVENLVIPSVAELATMWIGKYRFSHIQDSLRKEILHSNTLMFPRTIRLQKTLLATPNNKSIEVVEEHNNDNLQNVARLSNFDLNLEPRLLDLNQEPSEV
ncbi:PHD domain-containing protein [Cephalotus follicularis]|uniref:PHD domain-containing protein n=1 Tax=Cephalotus follicularis TaxID=3775 RepID=A0A1Q3D972_CEPFO|nr:PHD domain-containing protein [Cephalotus follicularis]